MKAAIKVNSLEQVQRDAGRETYFDCLRIIATFSVMILHIASQNWHTVDAGTYEWKVFSFYDSIVRWSVPVFVMISGALFLGREQSIGRIFKKNILRIVTAFIFWSALYALVDLAAGKSGVLNALREFVEGPSHLWFLFMIAGLYILVPMLKKIVADMDMTRYFVFLSLAFTFILPYLVKLISLYSDKFGSVARGLLNSVCFYFTLGYVSYFVYGYYFSRIVIKGKGKWGIYLLGIAGFIVTIFAPAIFPISDKGAAAAFHDNMTLNVMLESVALFVFAKNNLSFPNASQKAKDIIRKLSQYSFGAYLVHAMVIMQLNHLFGLNSLSFDPLISVPLIGIIVFVISFAVSGILHHVPLLNKYVV